MPRQSKARSARCRVPQQIDLFAAATPTIDNLPAWSGLPTEIQSALTALMTRLILDHADQRRLGSVEGGHDL